MSQAEELLNELATYSVDDTTEEHIVIGADRVVLVPETLQNIAVQYDHNIETVTFDCPRYWDEHDMSKMNVYVNYMLPNGIPGMAACTDITVDEADDSIMHFNWTISGNVTQVKGEITFLVCIKKCDAEGNEQNHWNSQLNREMYISEGLECQESAIYQHPDIIEHLLLRMDNVEAMTTPEYLESLVKKYLDENPELITDEIAEVVTDEEIHSYVDSYLDEHLHTVVTTDDTLLNSEASILRIHDISGVSEQETTTGAQLVDFGIGEITSTGTTKTWENDVFTLTGDGSTAYQNIGYDVLELLKANPGKTLSFGYESISIGAEGGGSIIQININNTDGTNKYASLLNGYGDVRGSYTIPDDTSDIAAANLRIYVKNSSTAASGTTKIVKPILYFGDVDSQPEYESYTGGVASPSPEYQQEIKSSVVKQIKTTGAQLIDFSKITMDSGGTTTAEIIDEGRTVKVTGTKLYAMAYIDVDVSKYPGKTIYLQGEKSGGNAPSYTLRLIKADGTKGYITSITNGYTILDDDVTIRLQLIANNTASTLETATTATFTNTMLSFVEDIDWCPYRESIIELSEPITLNGLTEYKDRIVKGDGVFSVERNVGSKVYDSNDFQEVTWTEYECATFFVLPKPEDAYTYGEYSSTEALCDKFTCNIVHPLDQLANVGNVVTAASAPNLWFGFEKGTTLETAKAVGDIYYMYALKESTFEPLPAADQIALNSLETFSAITYISTDSEVKPIVKSEYATDDAGVTILSMYANNEKNVVRVDEMSKKVDVVIGNITRVSSKVITSKKTFNIIINASSFIDFVDYYNYPVKIGVVSPYSSTSLPGYENFIIDIVNSNPLAGFTYTLIDTIKGLYDATPTLFTLSGSYDSSAKQITFTVECLNSGTVETSRLFIEFTPDIDVEAIYISETGDVLYAKN